MPRAMCNMIVGGSRLYMVYTYNLYVGESRLSGGSEFFPKLNLICSQLDCIILYSYDMSGQTIPGNDL